MPSQHEIFFWREKKLDVRVSREGNKFVTMVYRKPTFSGVYTDFDSFLPTTYKFGMIYTLAFTRFSICSNWTSFHNELGFLKDILFKNEYPISFIDKCFKIFLDWLYLERRHVLSAEKKTLTLILPFLGQYPIKPGQNFNKFSKEH